MEGDDNGLEDFDDSIQSAHVVLSHFVHVLTCRGVYSRVGLFHSAPPIVRRLFEGGIYSRAASIRGWRLFTEIWYTVISGL